MEEAAVCREDAWRILEIGRLKRRDATGAVFETDSSFRVFGSAPG